MSAVKILKIRKEDSNMFKIAEELMQKIKEAVTVNEPVLAGRNGIYYSATPPCSSCINSCSGGCKGTCTASCTRRSR